MEFQSHLVTALAALLVGMLLERVRSHEWVKQEQWKYKREIYERLLQTVSDYSSLLRRSRSAFEQNDLKRQTEITEEIEKHLLEIDRLTAMAKVFASEATMKALIDCSKRLEVATGDASHATRTEELRKVSDSQIAAVESLLRQVAETAKSDLEFQ